MLGGRLLKYWSSAPIVPCPVPAKRSQTTTLQSVLPAYSLVLDFRNVVRLRHLSGSTVRAEPLQQPSRGMKSKNVEEACRHLAGVGGRNGEGKGDTRGRFACWGSIYSKWPLNG